MKNRSGFVSNSSSSSFIVVAPTYNNPVIRVTLEKDVESMADWAIEDSETLEDYFYDSIGPNWKTHQAYVDRFDKMLDIINKRNVIYVCGVSNDYCDNELGNFIYNNGTDEVELFAGEFLKDEE